MDKDFDLEKPIHEDADENVYWHDAFSQALQMELHEFKTENTAHRAEKMLILIVSLVQTKRFLGRYWLWTLYLMKY